MPPHLGEGGIDPPPDARVAEDEQVLDAMSEHDVDGGRGGIV